VLIFGRIKIANPTEVTKSATAKSNAHGFNFGRDTLDNFYIPGRMLHENSHDMPNTLQSRMLANFNPV
jgi:hypothetical protein